MPASYTRGKPTVGVKRKFILSDLHLGAGYGGPGGNPLEDFLVDQALVNFLHEVRTRSVDSQCEIELIINGDFFEFLQVPAVEDYTPGQSYPPESYLDSSQQASVQRLNLIVQGHPDVFDSLSDFMHVEKPQRRITIIKGNHDVNLFWPGVKSRLREILGASGTRASLLLFADEFVSREKIYVEHGHQRAEKINAYPDFFNPRAADDTTQLHYPPGSRFIINTLNTFEYQYWFVDHIKPVTKLIWSALQWDFEMAGRLLVDFARVSGAERLFEANPNLEPLLLKLEDAAARQNLSRQYADDAAFRQQFHRQVQPLLAVESLSSETPLPLPPASDDSLEMAAAEQERQQVLLRDAATEISQREGARLVVFGHTHRPAQELLDNGCVYINAGSWTEDFTEAPPEMWQALFQGTRLPQKKAAPLSYVQIDYDERDEPAGKLMFYRRPDEHRRVQETGEEASKKSNWLARLLGMGK